MQTPTGASESRPAPQTIETLGQAAEEMRRLYDSLRAQAVPITPELKEKLLDGVEGMTWDRGGVFGARRPLFPRVTQHEGAVLVGAAYTPLWQLISWYRLTVEQIQVARDGAADEAVEALTIYERGYGEVPGNKYAVDADGRVYHVGHTLIPGGAIVPAYPSGHTRSYPRAVMGSTFSEASELDAPLVDLLASLGRYETR